MIFSTFDSEYGTYGQASASLWGYTIILLSLISVVFLNIIFYKKILILFYLKIFIV